MLADPQDPGDPVDIRTVSYLAARVKAVRNLLREAHERGLTREERASLRELSGALQELLSQQPSDQELGD